VTDIYAAGHKTLKQTLSDNNPLNKPHHLEQNRYASSAGVPEQDIQDCEVSN